MFIFLNDVETFPFLQSVPGHYLDGVEIQIYALKFHCYLELITFNRKQT